MKLQKGFTLVEIMVVVVIIGILASLVVPAYQEYVTRGRIPSATSALAAKRIQLEQFYQDNPSTGYVGAPACVLDTTTSPFFNISCTVLTATTYTLDAVGHDAMDGFAYTIDQSNNKQTTDTPNGWGAPANCWITRKGGAC